MDDPDIQRTSRPGQSDQQSRDEYIPGVCNIDRKGRWLRGGGAFIGLIFVVIYNEKWQTLFSYPVLYVSGMILLSMGTALSLIQAMTSFCVVDAFLGRTFIGSSSGKPVATTTENRQMDRKRALIILGGSLLAGALFSAVLLISEINQSRG
jgi:hypothetical protein